MIWRWEQFFGISCLAMYFGYLLYKKHQDKVVGLLSAWSLLSAVLVFFHPNFVMSMLEYRMKLVAARSFAIISMIPIFVSSLRRPGLDLALDILEWLAIVNTILVLIFNYGFFNANSMDATFVALMYSSIVFREKRYLPHALKYAMITVPLFLFATNRTGSTAYFVLAMSFGSYFLINKKYLFFLSSIVFIMAAGYLTNMSQLLDSSGRIEHWKIFMQWWWENANPFVGTGSGTFTWLGPVVQGGDRDLFIWMHNDYLQVLFEQGIIGFVLLLALIYQCLRGAVRAPWLFATNMGFLFAMFTQFPLRFLFTQILAAILVRISIEYEFYDPR